MFEYHIECRSILKTLKYMDNFLDKIFEKVHIAKLKEDKLQALQAAQAAQALQQAKLEEAKPDPPKENTETKDEKPQPVWSQEQQKELEKAIITFKDIKDPKEKWQKIAENVTGKSMSKDL